MDLVPPVLQDSGLGATLQWLAGRIEETNGVSVAVSADPSAEPESEQVRTLLFECARELLFNVVKHAGVKEARVVMERSDDEVRVAVEDRGRRFDPALIQSVRLDSAGFGLFSVQQRIELLGGRTEIHSAPGQGTRITLVAPILAQRR